MLSGVRLCRATTIITIGLWLLLAMQCRGILRYPSLPM